MIVGVGIDSVDIARFAQWHTYANKSLLRIFSQQEIDYCLGSPIKSAERFAARFAAREAFYKAYMQLDAAQPLPFLTVCKKITLTKTARGTIHAHVDWHALIATPTNITCLLSWTHTATAATAIVLLRTEQ